MSQQHMKEKKLESDKEEKGKGRMGGRKKQTDQYDGRGRGCCSPFAVSRCQTRFFKFKGTWGF